MFLIIIPVFSVVFVRDQQPLVRLQRRVLVGHQDLDQSQVLSLELPEAGAAVGAEAEVDQSLVNVNHPHLVLVKRLKRFLPPLQGPVTERHQSELLHQQESQPD